jgi:carbon monoxide dehydrogenase subunit G
MATELDHSFATDKPIDESYASILDLERLVPAVEGGSVTEVVEPEKVKAEILMRMGAMSMKLIGTVEVVEKDDAAHRAMLRVRSRESGGTGHANADVTFQLRDGGGDIHTNAQITGKAASMGEGVVVGVLDALIEDFTTKVGQI